MRYGSPFNFSCVRRFAHQLPVHQRHQQQKYQQVEGEQRRGDVIGKQAEQRRQVEPMTKSTHPNGKMHESTVLPTASGCKTPIFRKMAKIACIIHKYAVKYRIGVGKDSPHSHIHREPALRKAERKCLAECPGFP